MQRPRDAARERLELGVRVLYMIIREREVLARRGDGAIEEIDVIEMQGGLRRSF